MIMGVTSQSRVNLACISLYAGYMNTYNTAASSSEMGHEVARSRKQHSQVSSARRQRDRWSDVCRPTRLVQTLRIAGPFHK